MTLAQAIALAGALGLPRLDAQLLLLHALGRTDGNRAWLLTHDQDCLADPRAADYQALLQRRLGGEPVAYLTGHQAFYGLDLLVDARVLVPRSDTETLVDWALALPDDPAQPPRQTRSVMDLGTGSGAIALAVKAARPHWQVSALDASADALALARANAGRLQLDIGFEHGYWLRDAVGRFHVIVANPPYIADHDPHLPALRHEPLQALTSGVDGLDDIRQIVAQARAHLHPGGWLLLEHGYDQAGAVRALLLAAGFTQVQSRRDLGGIERCSGGRWLAPAQPPG